MCRTYHILTRRRHTSTNNALAEIGMVNTHSSPCEQRKAARGRVKHAPCKCRAKALVCDAGIACRSDASGLSSCRVQIYHRQAHDRRQRHEEIILRLERQRETRPRVLFSDARKSGEGETRAGQPYDIVLPPEFDEQLDENRKCRRSWICYTALAVSWSGAGSKFIG